jgi:hypothetical protein
LALKTEGLIPAESKAELVSTISKPLSTIATGKKKKKTTKLPRKQPLPLLQQLRQQQLKSDVDCSI